MDSASADFWDQRYEANRLPWDAGGVPPRFAGFLRRLACPGRALVPGCGSAYEVRALAEAGWDVSAIDFSPAAVARARRLLGGHASRVTCADFFEAPFETPFDLIYERTFLCSLPPARWPAFAQRLAELLVPGGFFAGFFFFGEEPEPPPFPLDPETAKALFDPQFERVEDLAIPPAESLPLYAGAERWQVWRRKNDP